MELLKNGVANPSVYLSHELSSMLTYPHSADEMASVAEQEYDKNTATSTTAPPGDNVGVSVIVDNDYNDVDKMNKSHAA